MLQRVFAAAGHKHLMQLAQLRKLWLNEIDPFLTQYSFPRNFSVVREFQVTGAYRQRVLEHLDLEPWEQVLKGIQGKAFSRPDVFLGALRRRLGRSLNSEEQHALRADAEFQLKAVILHLTVYDGAIAQAVRFEQRAYLQRIAERLPDVRIDEIRCHVGDLARVQGDQALVAELGQSWKELVPPDVAAESMPAFIHRLSSARATLVLYVRSPEVEQHLQRSYGPQGITEHLHQQRPDCQNIFQRTCLTVRSHLTPEQVRDHAQALSGLAAPQATAAPIRSLQSPDAMPSSNTTKPSRPEERLLSLIHRMRDQAQPRRPQASSDSHKATKLS